MSAGQNLYGLKEPSSADPQIVILRVDQSTGEPTKMVSFTVGDFDAYLRNSWVFWVVDNGFVYWVAVRIDKGETIAEIYWHELEKKSIIESASLTLPDDVTGILEFDVDDG